MRDTERTDGVRGECKATCSGLGGRVTATDSTSYRAVTH